MNTPFNFNGNPPGTPLPHGNVQAPQGYLQPAQYAPGYAPMPQAPAAPAGYPATPFAPPAHPGVPQAPVNTAAAVYAALQGFNEAEIETRMPFIPADVQVDFTISEVRIGGLTAESTIGLSFYIEGTVNQSSRPDICAPGGQFCHRIAGFKTIEAKKFAMSDLKQFMVVALADRGLQAGWQGDWLSAAFHMCEQNWCKGKRVFVQTSMTSPPKKTNGKPKIKAVWYPAA